MLFAGSRKKIMFIILSKDQLRTILQNNGINQIVPNPTLSPSGGGNNQTPSVSPDPDPSTGTGSDNVPPPVSIDTGSSDGTSTSSGDTGSTGDSSGATE